MQCLRYASECKLSVTLNIALHKNTSKSDLHQSSVTCTKLYVLVVKDNTGGICMIVVKLQAQRPIRHNYGSNTRSLTPKKKVMIK